MPTVVILGTGAFATTLGQALYRCAERPTKILIVGRTTARVAYAVRNITTAVDDSPAHIDGTVVDFGIDCDLCPIMNKHQPCLVVTCTSLHSPYEVNYTTNRWTSLLHTAGFGFTAPLQSVVAVRAAEAIKRTAGRQCMHLNACYPDLVNPLLRALDLPIACGLGNVGTLAAALARIYPTLGANKLAMAAHHRHLKNPPVGTADALVWLGDRLMPSITATLNQVRQWPRSRLNGLGATASGTFIARLLTGERLHENLPGPLGLHGGYPVLIDLDGCQPEVPSSHGLRAIDLQHRQHARCEGVEVKDRQIVFHGDTLSEMHQHGMLTDRARVPVHDWAKMAQQLLLLRETYRILPKSGRTTESEPTDEC
ncbi:hypothetical protein [Sciscionella marina]|uniref:hypothetical protein n=1 Tax=Sciscionella marina TaxID=508770 RepID=UPI0012F6A913|nr:hypothetical protein [Sciscionella marina]